MTHRELSQLAAGGQQDHRFDVRPEGPGGRVVLAVDVRRDRPADADVLGAGHDGKDPPGRRERGEQPAQRHPRLRAHPSALGVELERR